MACICTNSSLHILGGIGQQSSTFITRSNVLSVPTFRKHNSFRRMSSLQVLYRCYSIMSKIFFFFFFFFFLLYYFQNFLKKKHFFLFLYFMFFLYFLFIFLFFFFFFFFFFCTMSDIFCCILYSGLRIS